MQLIAFDACVLWMNLLISQIGKSAQDILDVKDTIPLAAWIAYVLVFALIVYIVMSKYFSEAWRSHRDMKKKRRLQQEQAFGDMIVEDLLVLQTRGVYNAKEVNKMLKRLGYALNIKDILPRWVDRNKKSQSDLKAELKAKHGDKVVPIIPPAKEIAAPEPKTKAEKVKNLFANGTKARAM